MHTPPPVPRPLESAVDGDDPLADAVVRDWHDAPPQARGLLERGLRDGIAAVPHAPQSFRALLADAEAATGSVPAAVLERAVEPYLLVGPLWMSIAQGPGSLVHTYSDPRIASILVRTGRLSSETAARRLLETQVWNLQLLRPGGLSAPGGSGYVHTLQVRLMHARVRAGLRRAGWAGTTERPPIDQTEMIRTWLDFTVVALRSLQAVGFEFTDGQLTDMFTLWQRVGRWLGIDAGLLSRVATPADALGVLDALDATAPPPTDDARVLTRTMLAAAGARLSAGLGMPADVCVSLMGSFCRRFHGDALADQLGIEPGWTASLVPTFADANRYRWMRAALDEGHRREVLERSRQAIESILAGVDGPPAYQAP